jgi:hypothetical protein
VGQERYDEIKDLYIRLRAKHAVRNSEYDLARQRYAGELWDSDSNPRPADRYSLTANYLKPFIDKSIQLLVGRLPAMQVMPNGTDEVARRHAEALEGILYGAWELNNAQKVLFNVAFNSFVLRRGLVYYWWDPKDKAFCFKSCVPDNFYPEWDGDVMVRALYVHRRLTDQLKKEYPKEAELIRDDTGMELAQIHGMDQPRLGGEGYTTVIDYYDIEGNHARLMGDAIKEQNLGYPVPEVPFIDFPCFPVGEELEPQNLFNQIVELNQYLCQLISQKADIIKKYSNPTIVDYGSGQPAETVRRAVQNDGSVIPAKFGSKIELLMWQGSTPGIDEQLVFVQDALYDLSGKPRSSFGQTITNQSGVVTNLALTPTLQSNEYHETIWGERLSRLAERNLQLVEKFLAGEEIEFRGYIPSGSGLAAKRWRASTIMGKDIGGWYKTRIKWPSAIRTDDPAYVQNDLSQLTSDPPAISLYTSLENRGVEDVEAEMDRIEQQLMDPRLHPDRMQAAMDMAGQVGEGVMPTPGAMPAEDAAAMDTSYEASGVPNADAVVAGAQGGY